MSEFSPLREAVDTLAGRTEPPDFGVLERRATRRGRRRALLVAVATAAAVAGTLLAVSSLDDDRRTEPIDKPGPLVVTGVPVWYDAKGLHRGDVVEQTPIKLLQDYGGDRAKGALALVRTGAVYLDPAMGSGEVWFHPWGGKPRIVGHNSLEGPGGDPNGDTAAWFDGSDLVVYDTAADREIARTPVRNRAGFCLDLLSCGEHRPRGNDFLEVSPDRVVWDSGRSPGSQVYSYDVQTGVTSEIEATTLHLADVHDQIEVYAEGENGQPAAAASIQLLLRAPGRGDAAYPDLETGVARLSPSGSHLLAVGCCKLPHGAVTVDISTGEMWRVPKTTYAWIAWSYDDIAMVETKDELLACDASRRACKSLPAERPFLMPTN